ncbi:ABC transporter ATP-binding protein [Aedoeadaptatus coli]|uniref:ABC transporter ATP-binding protein n=1 Tax=Aedoeadaptatus coli TaxID=2058292 RepID=UPI000D55D273|nr:ABC transporter ATP-binding protein [Peptoniphilus coli]
MVEKKLAPAVEMRGITKLFGDFKANDGIDLVVEKGEIHALLGENGAGKSTLMNVLYGLYKPTFGEVKINGEAVDFQGPKDAIGKGLGMVHQHFMLFQPFTVVENIILGEEPTNGVVLDKKTAREKVVDLSNRYGLRIDPDAKIEDISVGMQQRVEILKALYRDAEILIFDEPTAVLTPQEIDELIAIIKALAAEGKSIIIITHKLKEIKALAEKCTIIRRGQRIDTVDVANTTEADLAEMMVGRAIKFNVNKKPVEAGEVALHIENLHVKDVRGVEVVKGLNLDVRKGEIFGVAGVDGNGQSEFLEAITGLRKIEAGKVVIEGKDVTNATPKAIREAGMNNIPEDRNKRGLVQEFTVAENMVLHSYGEAPYSSRGILQEGPITSHADKLMESFDIRPRKSRYLAGDLSGGNQQKVILAREIDDDPDVLIAAQPTRGLDVGAIENIHQFLVQQRDKGRAVLLVSFELDEVMSLSDRIGIIYEGAITKTFNEGEADQKELGYYMAGGVDSE